MKALLQKIRHDEQGITLAEVLASVVLLSIVVMIFLLLLSNTAKTIHISKETVDATYVAQTAMESMYENRQQLSPDQRASFLRHDSNYEHIGKQEDWEVYVKHLPEDNLFLTLKLQDGQDYDMVRVLLLVSEEDNDSKPSAQMESIFTWGANK